MDCGGKLGGKHCITIISLDCLVKDMNDQALGKDLAFHFSPVQQGVWDVFFSFFCFLGDVSQG